MLCLPVRIFCCLVGNQGVGNCARALGACDEVHGLVSFVSACILTYGWILGVNLYLRKQMEE